MAHAPQDMNLKRPFWPWLFAGCLGACSAAPGGKAPPGYACIEAQNYASVVNVTAPTTATVGQWVTLHANRHSGPWAQVALNAIPAGRQGFETCPPTTEDEVSSNLTWTVNPPGLARFNLPAAEDAGAARQVMFNAAGTYRLSGRSDYPSRAFSNTVVIMVR